MKKESLVKASFVVLTMAIFSKTFAQDTIYTFQYPKGIVTNNLDQGNLYSEFNPIENKRLLIKIKNKAIIKINFYNGKNYVNKDTVSIRELLFPVDPTTGKIKFSDIINGDKFKAKELFNIYKTIPQGEVKLAMVSSDESDYTFQKYVGCFNIKYAGDPYIMYFNLLFRFKDGKVKYELTDFVSVFGETKSKNSANIFGVFSNGVNTITNEHTQIPEILYAQGGMSDEKHYWKPMKYLMEETITKLKKMIVDAEKLKNEGW